MSAPRLPLPLQGDGLELSSVQAELAQSPAPPRLRSQSHKAATTSDANHMGAVPAHAQLPKAVMTPQRSPRHPAARPRRASKWPERLADPGKQLTHGGRFTHKDQAKGHTAGGDEATRRVSLEGSGVRERRPVQVRGSGMHRPPTQKLHPPRPAGSCRALPYRHERRLPLCRRRGVVRGEAEG